MSFVREIFNRLENSQQQLAVVDFNTKTHFRNGQLLERSIAIAKSIEETNKHKYPVVIWSAKSFETYATLLACLRANIPFVPLADRKRLPEVKKRMPVFEINQKQDLESEYCSAKGEFVDKGLMYIIPTSGSTGQPKLIEITYDNFQAYLVNIQKVQPIYSGDRCSQAFELTFDPAIGEIIHAFLHGGVLAPFDFRSLLGFSDWLAFSGISRWASSPMQASLVLERIASENHVFKGIKESGFIGEGLSCALVEKWQEVFPETEVFNHYGPAEITVSISSFKIDRSRNPVEFSKNGIVSIGKPYSDHKWLIVGENNQEGRTGELCVSGPQVLNGYIGEEVRWYNCSGIRYYRTGDWVEIDSDKMYFLGRVDDMLKIRSKRFHTIEMEVFVQAEIGAGCVVIPSYFNQYSQAQGTTLVIDVEESKESLTNLITNMTSIYGYEFTPREVFYIERLPHNINGKLDRKAVAGLYKNDKLKKLY